MATSSSRHSPAVSEPAGETAATNENNPASLSNWLLKTKDFVINQLAGGYENEATAHLSPTDSCCSVAAHYGSPRTGCRSGVGRRLRKSGSPFRRRSNSQSHIDCLKIGQTSYPSSSTIHHPRPALSSDALAAMDVDHGTSDYLIVPESWNKQSTVDLGLESGSCAAVCSETADPHNDRLCCFEECPVASQSTSNTPARSLRVRLDKRLKVEQFKNRLGEYLKLDPRYLKVNVYPNRLTSASDFSELQPTDLIRISLESCLGLDEVKLTLHVLDLTGVLSERNNEESGYSTISPVWTNCIEILSRPSWSVDQILLAAAAVIRSEHHVDIPRSRLRLRKCNPAELTPGPVLGAKEILSNFTNPHQGLMVQLLSGGHFSGGAVQSELDSTPDDRIGNGFVFVRRWHPSTLSFDPSWHEVTIPVGADRETRWNTIMHWLGDHTGLPLELLEASREWSKPSMKVMELRFIQKVGGSKSSWNAKLPHHYELSTNRPSQNEMYPPATQHEAIANELEILKSLKLARRHELPYPDLYSKMANS
ncbi:unnamed protein product [Calicophoron daubneyi]|uniref:Uncharacterized protein n=1 Tax=Calicophoron daubneyi TaxID=300641 RepID=A0AAV2TNB0_CALDB